MLGAERTMISTDTRRTEEEISCNVDDECDNSFLSKALSNSVFFASALSSLSTAITLGSISPL
jgi:hypothetical protein